MAALLMFWGTFPGGGHLASDGLPAGANPGWPQIQLFCDGLICWEEWRLKSPTHPRYKRRIGTRTNLPMKPTKFSM